MPARALVRTAALALPVLLGLGACSSADPGSGTSGAADGPITVRATDTACEVARATAPAGTVEFTVTNTGSKVHEFSVYA